MATLKDYTMLYDGNGDFLDRVEGACIKKAGTIRTEDAGTTNHANRLIWAGEVELGARNKARQMIGRVLANGTISADPYGAGDGLIETVVGNLIDTYATGA